MKNWNIVNPWKIPQHTANAKLNDWEFFSGNLMIVKSISSDSIGMDNEHPMESTHAAMSWNTSVYPFSIKFYNIEPELFVCFSVFFSRMAFSFDGIFFVLSLSVILYPRIIIAQGKKKARRKANWDARTHATIKFVTLNHNRLCMSASVAVAAIYYLHMCGCGAMEHSVPFSNTTG